MSDASCQPVRFLREISASWSDRWNLYAGLNPIRSSSLSHKARTRPKGSPRPNWKSKLRSSFSSRCIRDSSTTPRTSLTLYDFPSPSIRCASATLNVSSYPSTNTSILDPPRVGRGCVVTARRMILWKKSLHISVIATDGYKGPSPQIVTHLTTEIHQSMDYSCYFVDNVKMLVFCI